jgi:hypothetical protein
MTPRKMLNLFIAVVILLIAIQVSGGIIEDAFGITNASQKLFAGIGGIAAIAAIYKTGIYKIFLKK